MKVTTVVDKADSAIEVVAKIIQKYKSDFELRITPFHPKRPSPPQLKAMEENLKWCDIIDCQYWKTGSKVRDLLPKLWNSRKKLLTHHNPYDLHRESWEDYDQLVVLNKTQQKELPSATWIPHCVDFNFFKFTPHYTKIKL